MTRLRAPSLIAFGVGSIVYNLAASVLAWTGGWPPQLGGDPDPDQPYASYLLNGSAVSAPLVVLVVLLAALVLARRHGRWAQVGGSLAALVAVVYVVGAVGEFVAEHQFVSPAVVFGFGTVYVLQALTLLALALPVAVHGDRLSGPQGGGVGSGPRLRAGP